MAAKPGIFVITGAPCAGKTTVIDELSKKGYNTIEEPSRKLLKRFPELRAASASKTDVKRLQMMILNLMLEAEQNFIGNEPVFLDGGIPSCIAFFKIRSISPPRRFVEACKNTKYSKVFMLERLPFYETDALRQQTMKESEKIQNLLYKAYSGFGYKPIMVPVLPPTERAKLIEKLCS